MRWMRWIWRKARLPAALALTLVSASGPSLTTGCGKDSSGPSCCKVCTTGKACGNTCIPQMDTCHQPPGCACNG